jgi:hypothetical protein
MVKYAIDQNGYIIGSEGVSEYYMLIEKPIPNRWVKWDFDSNDWVFDIDLYKKYKIDYVKSLANEAINNDRAFPLWRQNNLSSDYNYGLYALSTGLNMPSAVLVKTIVMIVGLSYEIEYLKNIYLNAHSLDFSTIIDETNPVLSVDEQIVYCSYMVKSTVVYRLIKLVRNWSNDTEELIKSATTKEEIDSIDLTTCPNINIY